MEVAMKRFAFILALFAIAIFAAYAFAEAPEIHPSESIPAGAGELVNVSTVGANSANYLILYTFRDPYGKLVTYAFHVGGSRVSSAGDLTVRLSHIIYPMR
jgi:hypothetical protein